MDEQARCGFIIGACEVCVPGPEVKRMPPAQFQSISNELMPCVGVDIIGLNIHTMRMAFGKRVVNDEEPDDWYAFDFPVTHWIYAKFPRL